MDKATADERENQGEVKAADVQFADLRFAGCVAEYADP